MIRRLVSFLLTGTVVAAMAAPLTGCIVATRERGPRTVVVDDRPRCHPSQHWDGRQCRHNGRGHGARKHDGRR